MAVTRVGGRDCALTQLFLRSLHVSSSNMSSGGGPSRIRNRKAPSEASRDLSIEYDDDDERNNDVQHPVRDTYIGPRDSSPAR